MMFIQKYVSMKLSLLPLLASLIFSCGQNNQVQSKTQVFQNQENPINNQNMKKSLYNQSFEIKTISGEEFDFNTLKEKRLLIVNTASLCGYTPQYKELQELHSLLGRENFAVIGFPANNFGNQEPSNNSSIAEFCSKNYGVEFLMMEKISVKGADMHPLYQWLTKKELNGVEDSEVKWNFQKFLIDENGYLIDVLPSSESPLSEKITSFAKG